MTTLRIPSANQFLALLMGVNLLLAVLYGFSLSVGGLSVFDLNAEANVPTWYSSAQLALLAAVLLSIAWRENARGEAVVTRAIGALFLAFTFFSLDEVAQIHERITASLKRYQVIPRFRGNHGIWILFYTGIAIAVLLLIGPGLGRFARGKRRDVLRFCAGAFIFVAGAVGLEILGYEGIFVGPPEVLMEEMMEMSGVSIMIWACLRQLEADPVQVCTGPAQNSSVASPPPA